MKPVYLLLTCLLLATHVWGQTEESPLCRTGLGVFGDGLGLHGTDTLTVWGDLVLDKAEIAGEGTLKLRGNRPAQLVANASIVPNLHIANATRVTLQGDLRVTQRLTVEKGTLDARPGTLILSNACRVTIGIGGKLVVQNTLTAASTQPRHLQPGPQQLDGDIMPGLIWTNLKNREGSRLVMHRDPFWADRHREEPTPPPENQSSIALAIDAKYEDGFLKYDPSFTTNSFHETQTYPFHTGRTGPVFHGSGPS